MGKQGKLILLQTRKPLNWQEWNEMKSRKQAIKEAITMIQAEARSILDAVMGAESMDQASEILKSHLPDRKHLTYWLGQIGRRKDARLGRNLDFCRYVNAVVENLRSRQQEVVIVSRDRDKKPKRKIVKQATAASRDEKSSIDENTKDQEELMSTKRQPKTRGTENGSHSEPTTLLSETNLEENQGQDSETNPPTPHLSYVQKYAIRNVLVYADCAVQKDESGIFDVLARNFADKGMVGYFLTKVGHQHLVQYAKNRDVIDYIRVVSRELFKEMKKIVGKPVARW
jgi:hypothetical protein